MFGRCLSWLPRILIALLACASSASSTAHAIEPDFLIDSDPKLEIPQPIAQFNPALKKLWLTALERPEIDMQRMAAETIAQGHQFGVPGLEEAVPRLESILELESTHPAARFAAARALIVLKSTVSGEKLWAAAQRHGADLRQLVEPALAEWKLPLAQEAWIARLNDPLTRRRDLVLALRGLSKIPVPAVLPQLVAMTTDSLRDPDVRLEAAVAAGQTADSGLEEVAEKLARKAQSAEATDALNAVHLLALHDSEPAQRLLVELAAGSESAVSLAALNRLSEIDLKLVLPLAEAAIQSVDPEIRWQAATAYVRFPTLERIPPLVELLADANPSVRRQVADELWRLSEQTEFDVPIREAAAAVLAGERWQGQEQAALLLGALEHKPVAGRLVELLNSPRPGVVTASAWALRKVAVAETAPALIEKCRQLTDTRLAGQKPEIDAVVAHLFDALAAIQATDAMPLLKQYVPKQPELGDRARAAAVRAIGSMHEGRRNAELEEAFSDRISDFADKPVENELVKAACAVALVRMRAHDQAPFLKGLATGVNLPIRLEVALRWAVHEMTGEEIPPPEPLPFNQGRWFLEPIP